MTSFIANKLSIDSVDYLNAMLLASLIIISALTIRRGQYSLPFSPTQTNQMRGLLILLVVLGHLWTHVTTSTPWLLLSNDSVAGFLFISGMGSTLSFEKKRPSATAFVKDRVQRVMFLYWFTTAIFLLLDLCFLKQTLRGADLVMTLVGININSATRLFDYVRWYITFQIFWYIFFILAVKLLPTRKAAFIIFFSTPLLIMVDYYLIHLGWSKYLAFPAGCLLGSHVHNIIELLKKYQQITALLILSSLGIFLTVKYVLVSEITHSLPSIVRVAITEINSLILTLFLIGNFIKLGDKGMQSRFLDFIGAYSYEIFLIHGPLLVKYNPVFSMTVNYGYPIILSFFMLMICIISVATILQRILRHVHA